jgi:hypothetical protein
MTSAAPQQAVVWRAVIPGAGTLLLASATGGMSGDIFNLYLTDTLGYDPKVLTWIYLSMLLSIPVQLMAPRLADRFGYRRIMVAGAVLCLPALVLLMFARPLREVQAGPDRMLQELSLVAAAVLVEIAFSISFGSVWSAWIARFSDRANRPVFLATLSVAAQGVMATTFLCQTVFFAGAVTTTFYHGVLLAIAVYLVGAVLVFVTLPPPDEPADGESRAPRISWVAWWRRPVNRFIAISEALQFLVGVPLLSVYLVVVLEYPTYLVSIALVARTLASLSLTLAVGRMIRARGSERIISRASVFIAVVLALWFLLPHYDGNPLLLAAVVLLVPALQLGKAALGICISDIQYELVPAAERIQAFTMTDLVSSSAMQVCAMLAALVISAAGKGPLFLHIDLAQVWIGVGVIVAVYLGATYKSHVRALPHGEVTRVD